MEQDNHAMQFTLSVASHIYVSVLPTRPRGLVGIGVAMHGAPSEVWIIPAAGLNWGCHHPCHRKAPSLTFFPHQLSKALPPGLAPLLSELGELRCPCLRLDSCATLGLGKFTKSLFAGCLLRCLVVGQQATKAFALLPTYGLPCNAGCGGGATLRPEEARDRHGNNRSEDGTSPRQPLMHKS